MKKFLLTFVMLFVAFSAFAQVAEAVLETEFSAVKEFFLPAVMASLLTLWLDTVKHLKGGNYDIMIALKTKVIPLVVSIALSVGIYYLLAFLPFTKPFIEGAIEADLSEMSAAGLITAVTVAVDNFYKTYIRKPVVATE